MHPAIIIGRVRSLIVDVAMGQIPRSTERISSYNNNSWLCHQLIMSFLGAVYSKAEKRQNVIKPHHEVLWNQLSIVSHTQ